ncbi:NUDIX hydrolase [Thalassotalea nanhaiensis]|uniref:Phosphatase NudJ n=1 Tax=Thalassotalea nanhaiensis TaxID=3065648 RepID=A0ABY9TPQ1_9GAMM|nr:NUDIX hydrolase [Colwelliaceae bacterium SQ345]
MTEQFKPNTTVAGIIFHQDKFLIVEEVDDEKIVYNQPAGHVEENENLIAAFKREVLEETGLQVEPDFISGIYYHYREDIKLHYLRFCFVVELSDFTETQPQDSDILRAIWLTKEELLAKGEQIRSPLVVECLNDFLNGNNYPLSILKTNITSVNT